MDADHDVIGQCESGQVPPMYGNTRGLSAVTDPQVPKPPVFTGH